MFDIVKNGALQAVVQEAGQRLCLDLDQVKGKYDKVGIGLE